MTFLSASLRGGGTGILVNSDRDLMKLIIPNTITQQLTEQSLLFSILALTCVAVATFYIK